MEHERASKPTWKMDPATQELLISLPQIHPSSITIRLEGEPFREFPRVFLFQPSPSPWMGGIGMETGNPCRSSETEGEEILQLLPIFLTGVHQLQLGCEEMIHI